MKKRVICFLLAFHLFLSSLFFDYTVSYATGLDAVVGWESTLAGATSTLLLPFGQVAFLLFSLFGVTVAVNNGESICEAGEEMWKEFTSWYENTFIPGLDVAHEKKEQMMDELMQWEEKAEDGIFSKVSQVWEALGEFAKYIKSHLQGQDQEFKSEGLVYRGKQSYISEGTHLELSGNLEFLNEKMRLRHCMDIETVCEWAGKPFGNPLVNEVAMIQKMVECNGIYRLYYGFVSSCDFYISWDCLDDEYASNDYTKWIVLENGLRFQWYREELTPSLGGQDLSSICLDGVTSLPTSHVGSWGDVNFNEEVAEFFGTGLNKDEEAETTLPGALGRDWNTVVGQDKANVQENDEAVVLTGEGIRSKEKTKEKEQEAEADMEGVLVRVSDASKSKENTKEQSEALEKAYEKAGVKGASDMEEAEKEAVKNVNLPSSENSEYQISGLDEVFPFCIPFDIYKFITCLKATPIAPHFVYKFKFYNESYNIDIDLSVFDSVAELFRLMEMILFIVGLAFVTRSHIIKS